MSVQQIRSLFFFIVSLAFIAIIFFTFYLKLNQTISNKELYNSKPLAIDSKAPDFTSKSLQNKKYSLYQQEQWTVLHFWASWCSPCLKEFGTFFSFLKKIKNLKIFAFAITDKLKAINNFLFPMEFFKSSPDKDRFVVFLDKDSKVSSLYKVDRIPETYLISPDFKIKKRYLGERDWESSYIQKEILEEIKSYKK